jgi:hypothetical protein
MLFTIAATSYSYESHELRGKNHGWQWCVCSGEGVLLFEHE